MEERKITVERVTSETKITVALNLDGAGKSDVNTGIGFFDHLLSGFARHGLFDLTVRCDGDLEVDSHHTIEDVGIVLGEAIKRAAGDKAGIKRYGYFVLPMDEALIQCSLDLSGRPYYFSDVRYTAERIGSFDTEMAGEFFYAVSYSASMNLHLRQLSGENNHHISECCFKAFAKSLDIATMYEPRLSGVWSTKGVL